MTSSAGTFVPPTKRQIGLVMIGLVTGMFLAALDQTVVATSIRTIGDDLNGLTVQAWVTTAYLIAATVSTPLYGKLSDIFGRKPLYFVALSLFVVGSGLAAVASTMYELAIYRFIQGAGGGGLMGLAIIILGDVLSPRERTKYQAAFFVVFGVASVLGPVVGGFFAGTDTLLGIDGWRWIFLVNVPLGLGALVLVMKVLNIPAHNHEARRIDWWGSAFLISSLAPLLTVLEQGSEWGWTSPLTLGLLTLSLGSAVSFVWNERRMGEDALIPLRMFQHRTVKVATIVNFIMGVAMFGGLAGLPLYLQISRGMTPTEAGLSMLPFTFGIILVAGSSAQVIRRTGHYKSFPIAGVFLLLSGTLFLSRVEYTTPFVEVAFGAFLFGMGLGGLMQPLLLAVQNALPARDNGAGTASVIFFRQIGGSLGTAIFLSLLFSQVPTDISDAFAQTSTTPEFRQVIVDEAVTTDPLNAAVIDAINSGSVTSAEGSPLSLDDTSFVENLHPVLAAPFKSGFADAIGRLLWWASGIIVIALGVIVFLPSIPLRETSGVEQMALDRHKDASA